MATLTVSDIADLAISTRKDPDRGKFTDLTSDIQKFVGFKQLMKKRETADGVSIDINLLTEDSGQASWTGLYDVRTYNSVDALVNANVAWRMGHTKFSMDLREKAINDAGKEKVIDEWKKRRYQSFVAWAKQVEEAVWTKPASSSDVTTPDGVAMFIVANASTGFNGGNPSGFTAGYAGVDSAVYTRWLNHTYRYTSVSKDDLVAGLRESSIKTEFEPPINDAQVRKGYDYGYYSNYVVISQLEELLEDQNENLGNDLASKDGRTMFKRLPVTYVPYLDDANYSGGDSTDPFYGINWKQTKLVFKKGWSMKESAPRNLDSQPMVVAVDVDSLFNVVCYNRRCNFVANTA